MASGHEATELMVTGANGALGRRVARAAALAGHRVSAVIRPWSDPAPELLRTPGIEIVRGDLRRPGPWTGAAQRCTAVAHLAAATSGDLASQVSDSVLATERLLAALDTGRLERFVHVSSFSVYDIDALPVGAVLDETAALEGDPQRRDAYTSTKLFQERLVRDAFTSRPESLVVLRPGAIYGPGQDWAHGIAAGLGRRFGLVIAPRSTMRLTYVDNCADAVVAALDRPGAGGHTVNIVDDELPTYAEFHRRCRQAGADTPAAIPVPWSFAAATGRLARFIDRVAFDGAARLPELLAPERQAARWQPLHYPNAEAHCVLGWTPGVGLDESIHRMLHGHPSLSPADDLADRERSAERIERTVAG